MIVLVDSTQEFDGGFLLQSVDFYVILEIRTR